MKEKKYIVLGALVLVVILIVAVAISGKIKSGDEINVDLANQEVSTGDPLDIVADFYNPWLDAVRSTSTDPYTLNLASSNLLSSALRERLLSTQGHTDTEIDPVLCQITVPEKVNQRVVSEDENMIRILVMARDKETYPAQSVFTLRRLNDGWYMDAIECAPGEFEAPREFTYEKEGFLLKNIPAPYNPDNWHIVFEENGQAGHVTPLFFDDSSMCKEFGESESPCNPDDFTQARKIHVYGQMTEEGANVKRLEFTESIP